MRTVGVNGLNRMFKFHFFLIFGVFITEIGLKVHFDQVFQKKVDFRYPVNPLTSKAFSKNRRNSDSYLELQMGIKWSKMTLGSS